MVLGGFCFMQKHCQKGQWCLWSMICLVGMESLVTHLARKVFMGNDVCEEEGVEHKGIY